jgi:hypothetical protein
MRRNCRKDRAGIRRKAKRNSEETAARNSEKKQARTPRKNRPGRRGKAGPDAEGKQARTPRNCENPSRDSLKTATCL